MKQIKCTYCLQKHLALCKSYMREVLDGHGEGGNPDHRDDIDGELTNAELHASVIDETMTLKIRHLRRLLQARRFVPSPEDMDALSAMYHHCDIFHGIQPDAETEEAYEALPMAETKSDVTSPRPESGCGCSKKN